MNENPFQRREVAPPDQAAGPALEGELVYPQEAGLEDLYLRELRYFADFFRKAMPKIVDGEVVPDVVLSLDEAPKIFNTDPLADDGVAPHIFFDTVRTSLAGKSETVFEALSYVAGKSIPHGEQGFFSVPELLPIEPPSFDLSQLPQFPPEELER